MKVITICGSMRYSELIIEVTKDLALKGNCVLTPIFNLDKNLTKEQLELLTKEHFKKIELSDEIFVINKDNYIGTNTKLEIEYAKSLNKSIIYYGDVYGFIK